MSAMSKVEAKVEEILARYFGGYKYDLQYGTSLDGIPYAFLVTGFWWYKVWVISCIKATQEGLERNKKCRNSWFGMTPKLEEEKVICWTREFVTKIRCDEFIQKCHEELQKGNNDSLLNPNKLSDIGVALLFYTVELQKDVTNNPDKYLKPGDIVSSTFANGFSHAGIYIGGGNVAHISGHGCKAESKARIDELCPYFVKPGGKIWVKKCVLHLRDPQKVVEMAVEYAEKGSLKGEYQFLEKNCQHFASLCAYGLNFSFEVKAFDLSLERTVICYMMYKTIRIMKELNELEELDPLNALSNK